MDLKQKSTQLGNKSKTSIAPQINQSTRTVLYSIDLVWFLSCFHNEGSL